MKNIKKIFFIFFLSGIILIASCTRSEQKISGDIIKEGEITLYRSSSCGCCALYENYLKGNVDVKLANMVLPDISFIKNQYSIPTNLQSCHTTIIGKYFVEGHIPVEAVKKLLAENPDIKGIAMPGMPSGSPGMPGSKQGDFVIYAVENDGNYKEFMRL